MLLRRAALLLLRFECELSATDQIWCSIAPWQPNNAHHSSSMTQPNSYKAYQQQQRQRRQALGVVSSSAAWVLLRALGQQHTPR